MIDVDRSSGMADENVVWQTDPEMSFQGQHVTHNFKDSVKSPMCEWTLDSLYSKMYEYLWVCCHVFHLTVTFHRFTFSLYCFSLCHTLCCIADKLCEHTTCHILTGFPPSSFSFFLLFHRHSSSGPLGMQTRRSWWFLLRDMRYSVISDLAFSSFRRRSRHSPWSLTAMLGYDESHKMQRRPTVFFCHPLRHPNSRHPFHLRQPCFVILSTDSSHSLSPTPFLYFQ